MLLGEIEDGKLAVEAIKLTTRFLKKIQRAATI
jgi:hypothetical protein